MFFCFCRKWTFFVFVTLSGKREACCYIWESRASRQEDPTTHWFYLQSTKHEWSNFNYSPVGCLIKLAAIAIRHLVGLCHLFSLLIMCHCMPARGSSTFSVAPHLAFVFDTHVSLIPKIKHKKHKFIFHYTSFQHYAAGHTRATLADLSRPPVSELRNT